VSSSTPAPPVAVFVPTTVAPLSPFIPTQFWLEYLFSAAAIISSSQCFQIERKQKGKDVEGEEFDKIKVEISKRQQLSPEFAAINPFKKLPAIVDERFKLFESHAILIYLASAFPGIADHCVRYLVVTSASLKLNGKSSSFQDVWCGPGIGLASDHASTSVDYTAFSCSYNCCELNPLLFLNSMTVLDCLIDQRLYIGLPDAKQRIQIFGVHTSGKQLAKDVDFEKLVFQIVGFSGADIRNLVNEAAIMMVRATLNAVEEVIEERDLDPLFSDRYTLFWIMLLLSKLAFSYYVEEMSRLTFNVKLDAADAI
ncbi:hypothetical protein HN51_044575, partial [Arachis hypogaea]